MLLALTLISYHISPGRRNPVNCQMIVTEMYAFCMRIVSIMRAGFCRGMGTSETMGTMGMLKPSAISPQCRHGPQSPHFALASPPPPYHFGRDKRGRSRGRGRGAFVRRRARAAYPSGFVNGHGRVSPCAKGKLFQTSCFQSSEGSAWWRYFSCRLSLGFGPKTQRPFLVGPS